MLEEPITVLTDTLIEMLEAIVASGAITPRDAANFEQIQRELESRRDGYRWGSATVN